MKLTFRNLERDIERYLDKYGEHTTIGGYPAVRGYDKAHEYVFDAYLQAEAYDAVVDYLLTFNWEAGINDWLRKSTAALRRDGRLGNIKRLWRGVIAKQKLAFWELHGVREAAGISSKQLTEAKTLALTSMATLRELALELDDEREAVPYLLKRLGYWNARSARRPGRRRTRENWTKGSSGISLKPPADRPIPSQRRSII